MAVDNEHVHFSHTSPTLNTKASLWHEAYKKKEKVICPHCIRCFPMHQTSDQKLFPRMRNGSCAASPDCNAKRELQMRAQIFAAVAASVFFRRCPRALQHGRDTVFACTFQTRKFFPEPTQRRFLNSAVIGSHKKGKRFFVLKHLQKWS